MKINERLQRLETQLQGLDLEVGDGAFVFDLEAEIERHTAQWEQWEAEHAEWRASLADLPVKDLMQQHHAALRAPADPPTPRARARARAYQRWAETLSNADLHRLYEAAMGGAAHSPRRW